MEIQVGSIVHYVLTAKDAEEINRRRTTTTSIKDRMRQLSEKWPEGAQAHIGTEALTGQHYPMMVVKDWGGGCVNGQVFLDGNDVFWTTSVEAANGEGYGAGHWHWPEN